MTDPNDAVGSDSKSQQPGHAVVSSGRWDDPHRLVENYFRGRHFVSEDPDTILLAWLAVLGPGVKAPRAAAHLHARLMPKTSARFTNRQQRLLALLNSIALATPAHTQNYIRRKVQDD